MKTRIGLAAAAAAALAAFPAEAGMFKAKGFEPAVYYTGERPIERGDAVADLGILYIHGWGGGADDRTALCRRLAKNVAKRGAKPVVFAPMFPIRRYIREKKIPDDGRAVWCGFWEVGEEGSAANDWRGGGDAYGTNMSSFDVVDRMVATLCDARLFPAMKGSSSSAPPPVDRLLRAMRPSGSVRRGLAWWSNTPPSRRRST